nr:ureidoglycolate lyase [Mobiluncus curtisii]
MTQVSVLPKRIERMERHDHTKETLCPTNHSIVLGVCAKEFDVPETNQCVLLEIPCGTALVMDKGTWHSPCFGVSEPTQYYWIATSDPRFPSEWVPLAGGSLETYMETESDSDVL